MLTELTPARSHETITYTGPSSKGDKQAESGYSTYDRAAVAGAKKTIWKASFLKNLGFAGGKSSEKARSTGQLVHETEQTRPMKRHISKDAPISPDSGINSPEKSLSIDSDLLKKNRRVVVTKEEITDEYTTIVETTKKIPPHGSEREVTIALGKSGNGGWQKSGSVYDNLDTGGPLHSLTIRGDDLYELDDQLKRTLRSRPAFYTDPLPQTSSDRTRQKPVLEQSQQYRHGQLVELNGQQGGKKVQMVEPPASERREHHYQQKLERSGALYHKPRSADPFIDRLEEQSNLPISSLKRRRNSRELIELDPKVKKVLKNRETHYKTLPLQAKSLSYVADGGLVEMPPRQPQVSPGRAAPVIEDLRGADVKRARFRTPQNSLDQHYSHSIQYLKEQENLPVYGLSRTDAELSELHPQLKDVLSKRERYYKDAQSKKPSHSTSLELEEKLRAQHTRETRLRQSQSTVADPSRYNTQGKLQAWDSEEDLAHTPEGVKACLNEAQGMPLKRYEATAIHYGKDSGLVEFSTNGKPKQKTKFTGFLGALDLQKDLPVGYIHKERDDLVDLDSSTKSLLAQRESYYTKLTPRTRQIATETTTRYSTGAYMTELEATRKERESGYVSYRQTPFTTRTEGYRSAGGLELGKPRTKYDEVFTRLDRQQDLPMQVTFREGDETYELPSEIKTKLTKREQFYTRLPLKAQSVTYSEDGLMEFTPEMKQAEERRRKQWLQIRLEQQNHLPIRSLEKEGDDFCDLPMETKKILDSKDLLYTKLPEKRHYENADAISREAAVKQKAAEYMMASTVYTAIEKHRERAVVPQERAQESLSEHDPQMRHSSQDKRKDSDKRRGALIDDHLSQLAAHEHLPVGSLGKMDDLQELPLEVKQRMAGRDVSYTTLATSASYRGPSREQPSPGGGTRVPQLVSFYEIQERSSKEARHSGSFEPDWDTKRRSQLNEMSVDSLDGDQYRTSYVLQSLHKHHQLPVESLHYKSEDLSDMPVEILNKRANMESSYTVLPGQEKESTFSKFFKGFSLGGKDSKEEEKKHRDSLRSRLEQTKNLPLSAMWINEGREDFGELNEDIKRLRLKRQVAYTGKIDRITPEYSLMQKLRQGMNEPLDQLKTREDLVELDNDVKYRISQRDLYYTGGVPKLTPEQSLFYRLKQSSELPVGRLATSPSPFEDLSHEIKTIRSQRSATYEGEEFQPQIAICPPAPQYVFEESRVPETQAETLVDHTRVICPPREPKELTMTESKLEEMDFVKAQDESKMICEPNLTPELQLMKRLEHYKIHPIYPIKREDENLVDMPDDIKRKLEQRELFYSVLEPRRTICEPPPVRERRERSLEDSEREARLATTETFYRDLPKREVCFEQPKSYVHERLATYEHLPVCSIRRDDDNLCELPDDLKTKLKTKESFYIELPPPRPTICEPPRAVYKETYEYVPPEPTTCEPPRTEFKETIDFKVPEKTSGVESEEKSYRITERSSWRGVEGYTKPLPVSQVV